MISSRRWILTALLFPGGLARAALVDDLEREVRAKQARQAIALVREAEAEPGDVKKAKLAALTAQRAARTMGHTPAADALAGLGAFLRGDVKEVTKRLGPDVLATFPSARRYIGLARLKLGDAEGAYQMLKGGALGPRDLEAQLALARLAAERQDFEAVRDAAAGIVALEPQHREASYLLAAAAEHTGDPARAEAAWLQAAGIAEPQPSPDPSYARPNRPVRVLPAPPPWGAAPAKPDAATEKLRAAWVLYRRGAHEAAIALLKDARDAEALYVRGLAQRRAGRLEAAWLDLEKALAQDPQRGEIRQALGAVLLDKGQAESALEVLGEGPHELLVQAAAYAQLGQAPKASALLVKLLGEAGDVGDAAATNLAALERAGGQAQAALKRLPARPLSPEGWLVRAQLLAETGDGQGAQAALDQALRAAPNYADAQAVRERLSRPGRPEK